MDEDGSYLLAPQVGAGRKENNTFTGVVMGVENVTNKDSDDKYYRTGLFGRGKGIETFFLDAEDGSLKLGASGQGQIYIDPASGGLLYNSAYITEYTNKGKPKLDDLGKTIIGRQGMLINLQAPYIHFADATGKIYSGNHNTFGSVENGFYLSNDGLSVGNSFYVSTSGEAIIEDGNSKIGA